MISNIKEFNTTSGNVVVNVKDYNLLRETITTHNSSTVLLCRFLRDALIGANIVDLIPDRIVPFKMDEDKFNNQEQHIEQNTTNYKKSKLEAYTQVWMLLESDVTQDFLNRFKPLFSKWNLDSRAIYIEKSEDDNNE